MKKKTLEIAAAVERDSALAGWSLVAKYSGLIFDLRKQLAARDAAIEKLQDDACEEVAALREEVGELKEVVAYLRDAFGRQLATSQAHWVTNGELEEKVKSLGGMLAAECALTMQLADKVDRIERMGYTWDGKKWVYVEKNDEMAE